MKLRTFKKGGVHPNDKKNLTKDKDIRILNNVDEVIIPLSQHLGAPAILIKNIGDHVEKGEIIAKSSTLISANIHASLSGVISEIKKITLQNSVESDAVVIKADTIQPTLFTEKYDFNLLSAEKILDIINSSGIVGQGGATFPTTVKLSIPKEKNLDYLIVNGVECEPYLTSDYRLMIEKTDDILNGIKICQKLLNPQKTLIGIEANKIDAFNLIKEKAKGTEIEPVLLKIKYPQGDEKQLISALTHREVPSGKLPLDVSCVVINLGTIWSIFKAVVYKMPLIERIVTVSGECIENPSNLLVPIGTPISHLIKECNGFKSEPDKIISGGPMMGFSFYNLNLPVCKGTSGIIAIKNEIKNKKTNCIHCGKCVAACPMGLQPLQMYKYIVNSLYDKANKIGLMDCKECGCCSYVCPAHLDLVQSFKLGKKLGRKK